MVADFQSYGSGFHPGLAQTVGDGAGKFSDDLFQVFIVVGIMGEGGFFPHGFYFSLWFYRPGIVAMSQLPEDNSGGSQVVFQNFHGCFAQLADGGYAQAGQGLAGFGSGSPEPGYGQG